MRHSKAIHGSVSMFAKLRPSNAITDHLLIGTIRFRYFTVAWNPETQQLDTMQSFEDLTEKYIEESNTQDRCLVDPTGNYFMMELYQGILSLGKIKHKFRKGWGNDDYLERPEQVRITELKVRASAFLYTDSNRPKIALLYEEAKGKMRLSTYRIVDEKMQSSAFDPARDRENDIGDLDMDANMLIPVSKGEAEERRHVSRNASQNKAQLGGVIVVGETMILYLDDESKASMAIGLTEAAAFVAWERYDDLNYLLADDYGKLHLLTIVAEGSLVVDIKVRKLPGTTSRATKLVYMGEGILFVASHSGDSQVIAVNLEEGSQSITVLQTMPNVAPVLDFAVMDMGNREGEVQSNEFYSGQARLVTCSGAFEDGSLRSVRSGVGLEDVGVLAEMEDIRDVFSLRSSLTTEVDDILVVSFPTESRVFTFDIEGQIEEVEEFRGLSLDQPILLAMNLPNGSLLQVTSSSVTILGQGPSFVTSQWKPPAEQVITAASANSGHVLLSSNGTTLVSLDIQNGLQCVASQPLSNSEQVACISVSSEIPNVGVVGFWKSGSLSILRLTDLQIIQSEDLRRNNNASIPRDICLTQILPRGHYGLTLFVAMEDGIVLTFNVDSNDCKLSGRKAIVLGTQQARLQTIPREDGLFNVFATCEHPSLIYGSEGSVVYSAVTAEDAVCVCSFNGEAYPGCIVVATPETLKISLIDTERRTHVQTLPIGKTVRRIAYSANEAAFAIGCIHRELVDGEERITSSLELVEEVLLGNIGKPFVFDGDLGPELVECVVRAELPIAYRDSTTAERFIVGTSYLDSEVATTSDQPNARGRILVFAVDASKNLFMVHSRVLRGACRRVAVFDDGKIVAALVKTVVVMKYLETTAVSAELTSLATYRTSTCPIDIDISGNIIAVADMMKSVSLIEYVPGKEGLDDKLTEIARHHEAFWSTAVLHLEENRYLETDMDGNIIILARNPEGVTLEDRKKLVVTSEINLGEMVNKIQRINVEPSPNALVIPKAFLATVSSLTYLHHTLLTLSTD
jgi:DNA damage-binding protein 1